jgi:spore germination protein YaaH
LGQYYADAREGDNYYQILVEGKKSIELKLRVMEEYGLAGVAEWCLGFETPEIWDVIEAYMKQ